MVRLYLFFLIGVAIMTRVLIADDQKLLRESFKNIIESNSDIKVIACAANGKEAFELSGQLNPDVVLMDIFMPVCSGTEATKLIKSKYPHIKILILSASQDEDDVAQAISNGADGYILKDIGAQELILSIKSISLGLGIIHRDVFKPSSFIKNEQAHRQKKARVIGSEGQSVLLSEREIRILEMIVEGKDNKQIGSELFIAEGTVKNCITELISKLCVKDRTQLAVYAIKNNLA